MLQFAVFCPSSLFEDLVPTFVTDKAPQDYLLTWNNSFYTGIYNVQTVLYLTEQKWYSIRVDNNPLTALVLLLNGSKYLYETFK